MIRVEAVRKRFGDVVAVDEVSFEARDGLVTGLLGPNGAGKTTTLARALVHRPQNVILDEPTNGLDVMATRAVREVIRALSKEGRCVVFSSHVMQEVSVLCDRIVVIARGRVAADGTPDELRQQTGEQDLEDAFVALIGEKTGEKQEAV
jgi:sodium transport system ATP-binding protein